MNAKFKILIIVNDSFEEFFLNEMRYASPIRESLTDG
jgi:hypothetical protein